MQRDASHGASCHGDHGARQPAGGNVQGMEQSAACGSQHDRENDGSKQGNRVKNSCGDEAREEVVVPGCDLTFEPKASLPGAFRIRLWAMCLRVVKLAGA